MSTMSPIPVHNRDDPKKEDEEDDINSIDAPQFIIADDDADSDEFDGDMENGGYQLLPQDPFVEENDNMPEMPSIDIVSDAVDDVIMQSMSADELIGSGSNSMFNLGDPGDATTEQVSELWNAPRPAEMKSEPMDSETAEKIKAAMSGFVLPPMNHPDWAKVIPEEEWKSQLFASGCSKGVRKADREPSSSKSSAGPSGHS